MLFTFSSLPIQYTYVSITLAEGFTIGKIYEYFDLRYQKDAWQNILKKKSEKKGYELSPKCTALLFS